MHRAVYELTAKVATSKCSRLHVVNSSCGLHVFWWHITRGGGGVRWGGRCRWSRSVVCEKNGIDHFIGTIESQGRDNRVCSPPGRMWWTRVHAWDFFNRRRNIPGLIIIGNMRKLEIFIVRRQNVGLNRIYLRRWHSFPCPCFPNPLHVLRADWSLNILKHSFTS